VVVVVVVVVVVIGGETMCKGDGATGISKGGLRGRALDPMVDSMRGFVETGYVMS